MAHKISFRIFWSIAVLVGALSLFVPGLAVAADSSLVTTEPGLVAEVELAGVVMFRFSHSLGGYTPQERAAIVYRRLGELLKSYGSDMQLLISTVRVEEWKGTFVVVAGEDRLVTSINPEHARSVKAAPSELAEIWAENMRRALKAYALINAEK